MTTRKPDEARATLDPGDWEEFRSLGHAMLDDMVDFMRTTRERPAWRSPSAEARAALSAPVPRAGADPREVYATFRNAIQPYPTGNVHPRFWGWVMGNGTPVGFLADMLGSALNCNVPGYDQAAALVERETIRWLVDLMDYPADASGLFVSGGSMANLMGLAIARNHAGGARLRREGLQADTPGGALTVYGSAATHSCIARSCDLLGLGQNAFRQVPADARHRVRVDELAAAIRADRARGLRPFCIVASAGTVACGATDDLNALADLARAEGLWLHVDGAIGALVKLSPRYRHVVDGLERADSIAFDLHKWGYMQYEVGAVLVRDPKAHADAFSYSASYLENFRGGIAVDSIGFSSRGLQLSRGFRALKVWMHLSIYGSERIGRMIEQNIDDVAYLRERIGREPELEVLGPSELNILCFRYVLPGAPPEALDALNAELLVRIQESGVAVPSSGRIDGRLALRVANTNHRTVPADFDLLVETVLRLGRELTPRSISPRSASPSPEARPSSSPS
jgi:glutamate/tyrosine decarboxylase-like PLP-dependent enzyme